jgi:hypothetical protein
MFRRFPLETNQGCGMKVNWVLSSNTMFDPLVDIDQLKSIGPLWGSWNTWRTCQTDNVVCYDIAKAKEFINRNYQTRCNFYIPSAHFQMLEHPNNVKLYEGIFNMEVYNKDDIVCMHLVANNSDIVLLHGFNLLEAHAPTDKLQLHQWKNYRNLVKQIVTDNPTVQWVLIDHPANLDKDLEKFTNLTTDSLSNVIKLLLQ